MTEHVFTCHHCGEHTGEFEKEYGEWKHKNLLTCIANLNEQLNKMEVGRKEFTIYWTGTVVGKSTERADSLEEAILRAPYSDIPIEIEEYPDDWTVDEKLTNGENK